MKIRRPHVSRASYSSKRTRARERLLRSASPRDNLSTHHERVVLRVIIIRTSNRQSQFFKYPFKYLRIDFSLVRVQNVVRIHLATICTRSMTTRCTRTSTTRPMCRLPRERYRRSRLHSTKKKKKDTNLRTYALICYYKKKKKKESYLRAAPLCVFIHILCVVVWLS